MSAPTLTAKERDLVKVAIQELQDLTYWGTREAADAGLEDLDALDQVTSTRDAVSVAMKIVTAFRRRVVRSDMSAPTDAELAAFELEAIDVELETLWRAVFGIEPRPTIRRRALARLWGAAMTVDWSHVRPKLPVGLVLVEGGES